MSSSLFYLTCQKANLTYKITNMAIYDINILVLLPKFFIESCTDLCFDTISEKVSCLLNADKASNLEGKLSSNYLALFGCALLRLQSSFV